MDKLILSIAIEDILYGMFVSVPPGYVACIYSHGSGVLLKVLKPGLHVKMPFWHKAKLFNTQIQEYTVAENFDPEKTELGDYPIPVVSTDGQHLSLEMTILFHVDAENATSLWQHIGDNYVEKIIRPIVRSRIRTVAADYDAGAFFTSKRAEIERRIHHELVQALANKAIITVDVLLSNISTAE